MSMPKNEKAPSGDETLTSAPSSGLCLKYEQGITIVNAKKPQL
jgi:hypothetical protein